MVEPFFYVVETSASRFLVIPQMVNASAGMGA
jgi:hypothetical protein